MVLLEYGGTPIADIKKAMIANMQEQWVKWDGQGLWAIKAVLNGEAVGCAIWGVKDGKHKKETHDEANVLNEGWEARRHLEFRQAFSPPRSSNWSQWRKASTSNKPLTNAANDLRDTAHAKLMQLHAKWVDDNTRFLCELFSLRTLSPIKINIRRSRVDSCQSQLTGSWSRLCNAPRRHATSRQGGSPYLARSNTGWSSSL